MEVEDLTTLRKIIDVLDDEILALISERQQVVERIGKIKSQQNLPIFDEQREKFLERYHTQLSTKYGLSLGFVTHLFEIIIAEAKRTQEAPKS